MSAVPGQSDTLFTERIHKHRLIGVEEVSVGTLTSALVHPREVFKALLLANAAAFAVADQDVPLIAIAGVFQQMPDAIFARGGSGIAAPADLEGKEVISSAGDSTRTFFPALAEANDFDADAVTFLNVSGESKTTTFIAGRGDAMLNFASDEFLVEDLRQAVVTSLANQGYLQPEIAIDIDRPTDETKTTRITVEPGARIERREMPGGYPNADRVMRGGMLIACHHGLNDAQIDYVHENARAFLSKY